MLQGNYRARVFYAILKISCHQRASSFGSLKGLVYFMQQYRYPAINGLRRSEVLGDNLSARYIHNNHKLAFAQTV